MVLKPNLHTLEHMLKEILDHDHPSHICGTGPEQDYLSRYYVDHWSHIEVSYNFQLHQMFLALSPRFRRRGLRELCISNFDDVKVIHYSGCIKPSSRFSESQYQGLTDAEWLNIYI